MASFTWTDALSPYAAGSLSFGERCAIGLVHRNEALEILPNPYALWAVLHEMGGDVEMLSLQGDKRFAGHQAAIQAAYAWVAGLAASARGTLHGDFSGDYDGCFFTQGEARFVNRLVVSFNFSFLRSAPLRSAVPSAKATSVAPSAVAGGGDAVTFGGAAIGDYGWCAAIRSERSSAVNKIARCYGAYVENIPKDGKLQIECSVWFGSRSRTEFEQAVATAAATISTRFATLVVGGESFTDCCLIDAAPENRYETAGLAKFTFTRRLGGLG